MKVFDNVGGDDEGMDVDGEEEVRSRAWALKRRGASRRREPQKEDHYVTFFKLRFKTAHLLRAFSRPLKTLSRR